MTTTNYTEFAIDHLSKKGLRITRPRKMVISLLAQSQVPLSVHEIKDQLTRDGESIDTVSVYRIIDCLETHHLIHRVLSSGKVVKCHLDDEAHCELDQDHHCHHLLICNGCGQVAEIHCPETLAQVTDLPNTGDFVVTGHRLELTGLCGQCA